VKIQQSLGISQERFLPTRERGKEVPAFQQILQEKQLDLSQNRLQSLLNELNQHETRLSLSRSLQDLMSYKQTIRNFLKEVVQNGVSIEEHLGSHPNGREKRLKLIKQVDHHLLELSEQVLEKQAPTVDLLEKMGEIKGLLVNLYL
jgi:uncharacterized protein YaaR (DUF327 family)